MQKLLFSFICIFIVSFAYAGPRHDRVYPLTIYQISPESLCKMTVIIGGSTFVITGRSCELVAAAAVKAVQIYQGMAPGLLSLFSFDESSPTDE